jgi:hypothetical protein
MQSHGEDMLKESLREGNGLWRAGMVTIKMWRSKFNMRKRSCLWAADGTVQYQG